MELLERGKLKNYIVDFWEIPPGRAGGRPPRPDFLNKINDLQPLACFLPSNIHAKTPVQNLVLWANILYLGIINDSNDLRH